MTLIVEDGTGKKDADSYVDLAFFSDYADKWRDDADTNSYSDAAIERALRRATRYVDSHRFLGWQVHEDQGLAWPRAWVGWIDGKIIDTKTIPEAIKHATAEGAVRELQGDGLLVDHDGGTIKREMKQVGDLRKETEFASPRQAGKTFQAIRALLKPYLQTSRGLQRTL
jgi:hypothetical protein